MTGIIGEQKTKHQNMTTTDNGLIFHKSGIECNDVLMKQTGASIKGCQATPCNNAPELDDANVLSSCKS